MVVPVNRGDIEQAGAHRELHGDARHAADDALSRCRAPSSEFGPARSVSADSKRQVTSAFNSMSPTWAATGGTGTVGTMCQINFLVAQSVDERWAPRRACIIAAKLQWMGTG